MEAIIRINILIDSFKGSISSIEISKLIKDELLFYLPESEVRIFPVFDGGEGTVEALTFDREFSEKSYPVTNPYNKKINASYRISERRSYIEMCSVSGFSAIKKIESPYIATSYGTGELLREALEDDEVDNIVLGIGGSLTNDLGAGMLQALGMNFFKEENILGKDLTDIKQIDISNFLRGIKKKKITVLCDVDNPLLGENGAARVYARQKGASDQEIELLEKGAENFHRLTRKIIGKDVSNNKGAGAAGGMGYALMAFFDAQIINGFDFLMKRYGRQEIINKADLIITGEGKFDDQSFFGKPVGKIIELSKVEDKKVIVICGQNTLKRTDVSVFSILDHAQNIEDSMLNPEKYIKRIVKGILDEKDIF